MKARRGTSQLTRRGRSRVTCALTISPRASLLHSLKHLAGSLSQDRGLPSHCHPFTGQQSSRSHLDRGWCPVFKTHASPGSTSILRRMRTIRMSILRSKTSASLLFARSSNWSRHEGNMFDEELIVVASTLTVKVSCFDTISCYLNVLVCSSDLVPSFGRSIVRHPQARMASPGKGPWSHEEKIGPRSKGYRR